MIEDVTAVIIDDNTAVGTAMATEIPLDSIRIKKIDITSKLVSIETVYFVLQYWNYNSSMHQRSYAHS